MVCDTLRRWGYAGAVIIIGIPYAIGYNFIQWLGEQDCEDWYKKVKSLKKNSKRHSS